VTLYLDTSSLVKLYVTEPGSDAVHKLVNAASVIATSSLAYPEARAALARRRRERTLRPAAFALAKRTLDADWTRYLAVEVTASICRAAGDLAERYRLRAYDSVHLATFAEVARRAGVKETRFSSFDDRLNKSARRMVRSPVRATRSQRQR
jgi:uncharacterized protein